MTRKKSTPSRERSAALHREACTLMPGGVNSPVRAFKAVGGEPIYYRRGEGAWFEDEDGARYLDLCCSWGALILGHAPPAVLAAVREVIWDGLSFGAPCRHEIELARRVVGRIPAAERVRFVNSGTEAVMTAVRLARGHTGRDLILKFDGGYHGHSDALLVKGGSGLATFGTASSAGVPEGAVKDTAVLPFDDDEALETFFGENGARLAAVLMEPVPANAGLLLQRAAYLHRIRDLCREHGALLVLDEVISGFRVGPAGAAGLWGLDPDLVTYGKVIGGGLPVGAVAGRAEIMERLAPLGPVYQAGTLSGNPVAMAGGAAALRALDLMEDPYGTLEKEGLRVEETVRKEAEGIGGPVTVARIGSLFWIAFQEPPAPRAFHRIDPGGVERYGRFHRALLEQGVYFPPSGYEVCFLSTAHAGGPTDRLLEALRPALREAYA